jgi:hypothetical protein
LFLNPVFMEKQLEAPQQEMAKAQAPGLLDRFREGLNNLVNFVLNRAPKSDAATRQDVKKELDASNPHLAQKMMKMESTTYSPGHSPAGKAYERETAEPQAKKKG